MARLPDLNRQLQARPQAFQPIPQPSHRRTRGSRTHNPCHHEGLVLFALASRQHRRFCRPHRLRRGGGSMSAVNLRVSGVGGASPHASAASSASRTISERRFPVRAASWSSLALSPWGSRTVTDGERTPGELSDGLPAPRASVAASTSSSARCTTALRLHTW